MPNPQKVGFISLGCPKALVDSERILTQLRFDGYEVSPSYEDAGVVIVNTCGFIDSAKEESLATIGEALEENGRVLVTGCMGGGDQAELVLERHPKVLGITGPAAYEEVLSEVRRVLPNQHKPDPKIDLIPAQGVKLTPKHYAYLKISEGCNHRCRFCIIPSLRGDLVSRPVGEIMREAEQLVRSGVKELLVISQDTSAYGVDLKYRTDFWDGRPLKSDMHALAAALGDLDVWVRMHYVYPYPHVDKVIPLMADGKILPYLDIPLQHGSPTVLKRMKRPAASEKTLDRIASWRQVCPDITLRSTFIVGFPGETEAEFDELLDFMQEAQLDRVGCFKYSAVDGATANELANPVPEAIKEERWHRFMALQQDISAQRLSRKVGQSVEILIDEITPDGAVGRTKGDAPEIDGVVFVDDSSGLRAGDVIKREVTKADNYDLWTR
ncbi:MAG: 30S ribosomal protein S12 methylthiotransferase RimO [Luminiphilus sp.]|jgi:ribosomal protein S12 methylthiotransferase|nr:30S ribosomal protein S12 methylthiotransferase RimO [Pseudomonadales bacterium]MBL6824229.1 30S ribosomal protein S12 methylthiotransferase RimO [Luminiphilus sp.]MBL6902487.1 30S ribosomal protein S12 methylthiotransferase RimO [Luminiphilus sp.]